MKRTPSIATSFKRASLSRLLLGVALSAAAGCGGTETDTTPDNQVDVPEVQGDVASADFCKLHDEIACAGALGCCDAGGAPFASEAECQKASTCETDLAALLASPLVADGTVVYDAKAAGDYLRAQAEGTSSCDTARDTTPWASAVLAGTISKDADCSKGSDDIAGSFVCKPGLTCDANEDPATGEDVRVCAPAGASAGNDGDPCSADEDCNDGACVSGACEVEPSALYCAAPPDESPPPNWQDLSTSSVPEALRITVNSTENSGTTNDITLMYRNMTATYSCTITETIADGGTYSCTPTQSSTTNNGSGDTDYFYVKYANSTNSDGLLVTAVAVKHSGVWYEGPKFGNNDEFDVTCTGCNSVNNHCNSCWIDGDGHHNCKELKMFLYYSDNVQVWCVK